MVQIKCFLAYRAVFFIQPSVLEEKQLVLALQSDPTGFLDLFLLTETGCSLGFVRFAQILLSRRGCIQSLERPGHNVLQPTSEKRTRGTLRGVR